MFGRSTPATCQVFLLNSRAMIKPQAKRLFFLVIYCILISACAKPTSSPAITPIQVSNTPLPDPTDPDENYPLSYAWYTAGTQAPPKPDCTAVWPTNGWRSSAPEEQGIDSETLADMMEVIQERDHNLDSLTIARNGYVVTDAYFYPFTRDTKHIIHSCTKSIVSALIGIAIENGYIESVDQSVLSFFPEKTAANSDAAKETLTLEHLLMMGSGLDCRDSYLYNWRGLNEMRASNDWVQYMLDLPMVSDPGTHFEYCNGASYLLAAIIQETTGMSALEFAEVNLFGPLGITDVDWPASPEGVNYGWGEMYLKPHDMAKIGFLYLNDGRWEEKQIIPSSWVHASSSPQIASGTLSDNYGYQWWVDSGGYYMALGYAGQFIFVVPEKNMVVVFTSGGDFPVPETLLDNFILPAAISEGQLKPNSDGVEKLNALIQTSSDPPAPEPAASLPDTAERINGQIYMFDPNNLDFKHFSLSFGENKAIFSLSYRDRHIEVDVGLDGIYRLTDAAGYTRAYRGYWSDNNTFSMDYQIVGYSEKGEYNMRFDGDQVTIEYREASTGTLEYLNGTPQY